MSRGRHSRPRASGGGLATFLALALAGTGVGVAVAQPGISALRWCVVGISAAAAVGLLVLGRTQRTVSRSLVRTEDRLRALEQRNRDEGDDLHRRVIEAITREGELRYAVEVLSMEISRLRASLQGFVPPVTIATAPLTGEPSAAEPEAPEPQEAPVVSVDIPLVQRVLVAQERATEPAPQPPSAEPSTARSAEAEPVMPDAPTRSWVVRELQLDEEPGVALTMRILDLTTPPSPAPGGAAETPAAGSEAESEQTASWPSLARPA